MNFIFLGDVSLNDKFIEMENNGLNPFTGLIRYFKEADYVVGNIECLPKGEFGFNYKKKPRLHTTIETLRYLTQLNLNVACLAHNHIYDNLDDGLNKAIKFFNDNKIKYCGASIDDDSYTKPLVLLKGETSIALLNYVTEDTNPNKPEGTKINLNLFDEQRVVTDINNVKQIVQYVIVVIHWGGRVEGGGYPDWNQQNIAHILVDNGADLIIGHHTHTIQPFEVYKGKYIFYSLGNFCFSDVQFDGKLYPLSKSRKKGLVLKINFTNKSYKIDIKIVKNYDLFFILEQPNWFFLLLKNIMFKIIFLNKFFWWLYFQKNKYIRPVLEFLYRKDITFSVKIKRAISFIIKKYKK